jgi:hypothetical protein
VAITSLVGGVSLALAAAVHVSYFQGSVRLPARDGTRSVPRRQLALAVLVIVAGIAGGAVVRTVDLAVTEPDPEPLPDDAAEATNVAIEKTDTASHRRTITISNESGGGDVRPYQLSAVDYTERQLRIRIHGDEGEYVGGFMGEGVMANHLTVSETPVPRSEWIVYPYPGWGFVAGNEQPSLLDEADWQFHDETGETLTYRIDDPEAVDETLASGRPGSRGGFGVDTHAILVVDRSAGVVERVTYHLESRETGNAYTYVERYEDVRGDPVDRPDTLGTRRWYEWVYDALYY